MPHGIGMFCNLWADSGRAATNIAVPNDASHLTILTLGDRSLLMSSLLIPDHSHYTNIFPPSVICLELRSLLQTAR